MAKRFVYKVYRPSRTAIYQRVYDGNFESINNDNFTTYWSSVGTPTLASRNRLDAYPSSPTGYAIELDGATNYFDLPSVGELGSSLGTPQIDYSTFTFNLWWYKANWAESGTKYFVDHIPTISYLANSGFSLKGNGTNLIATVSMNGTLQTATYALASISTGWHMVTFGSDGRYIRLYVDGSNVATYDAGSTVGVRDYGSVMTRIGASLSSTNFGTGTIDNISMYDTLLSTTQISQMYQSRNPLSSNLMFHFDLNETSGTVIRSEAGDYSSDILGTTPTWTSGLAGTTRSVMIKTDTGGSAAQGLKQSASYPSIITGGATYTGHARVKATAGETINLTITPTGGGSAQTKSIVANGSWQQLVNVYASNAAATALTIEVNLSNANSSVKTFYIDQIALNDGSTAYDYFDQDTQTSGSDVYSLNYSLRRHSITSTVYTYVGTWNDVVSDFSYPQEINGAGSGIQVDLAREATAYGEGTDVDFGLEVRVYLVNDSYPNGQAMFTGYIADYTLDEEKQLVQVTLFGYGAEMQNFISEVGPNRIAYQRYGNTNLSLAYWGNVVVQTLSPTTTIKLKYIYLEYATDTGRIKNEIKIYRGDPTLDSLIIISGTASWSIDTSNVFVATSSDYEVVYSEGKKRVRYEFTDVTLYPGNQYYFGFYTDQAEGSDYTLSASNSSNLSNLSDSLPLGRAYYAFGVINNAGFGITTNDTYPQLYCEVYSESGSTTADFESVDPSLIVRKVLDNYLTQGGQIGYDTLSIPLTGTVVSYEFKSMTVLDVIKKCLELAPVDWYFYIDQANKKLYFRQKSTTPTHTFIMGKHFKSLKFEKRTQDMANAIYFTGGTLSTGENLYKYYSDENSITKYGRRVLVYTDGRVKRDDTADTIATTILGKKAVPEIRVPLEVLSNYDLESIRPGDTVSFRSVTVGVRELSLWDVGYWDEAYWDYNVINLYSLELQIASFVYRPDYVGMTLSTTPPDVNKRIEDINRNLEAQQTINNPSAPS